MREFLESENSYRLTLPFDDTMGELAERVLKLFLLPILIPAAPGLFQVPFHGNSTDLPEKVKVFLPRILYDNSRYIYHIPNSRIII
jgi:hypothetical protein